MFRVVRAIHRCQSVLKHKGSVFRNRCIVKQNANKWFTEINRHTFRYYTVSVAEQVPDTEEIADGEEESPWEDEAPKEATDTESKAYYCNKAMYTENLAKAYHKTIKIFEMMETEGIERNSLSYKYYIKALVNMNRIEEAELRKDEALERGLRSCSLFSPLIEFYCYTRALSRIDNAVMLYKQMEEHNIPLDSLTASFFVDGYCKRKMFSKAEKIYYSFRSKSSDVGIPLYNSILPVLVKQQKFENAMEVYKEMMDNVPIYRIKYTRNSSLAIISILAAQRNFRSLKLFLQELPESNIQVTNDHILAAINTFSLIKAQKEIFHILDFCKQLEGKKFYNIDRTNLHLRVMESCISPPNPKLAELLLDNFKSKESDNPDDVPVYSVYAVVQLNIGNDRVALDILKNRMLTTKHRVPRRAILEFFDFFLRRQEFKKAARILKEFEGPKYADDFLFMNYKLKCASGETREAYNIFKSFIRNDRYPSLATCNMMLESFIAAKDYDAAESLFLDLQEHDMRLNLQTYESVLRLIVESRDLTAFLTTLEQVKAKFPDQRLPLSIEICTIEAFHRAGEIQKCQDAIHNTLAEYEGEIDASAIKLIMKIIASDTPASKKEIYAKLWYIVKRHRIQLDHHDLLDFLDIMTIIGRKDSITEIYGTLVEVIRSPGVTIDRQFCTSLRNSLVSTQILTQASKYWSIFLKYQKVSQRPIDSEEKSLFIEAVDGVLKEKRN